jgi:hypothetical protein
MLLLCRLCHYLKSLSELSIVNESLARVVGIDSQEITGLENGDVLKLNKFILLKSYPTYSYAFYSTGSLSPGRLIASTAPWANTGHF